MPEPLVIYSISEITNEIKDLIEFHYPTLWLKGEISNLRAYPSGHLYFTLKDENAQISAVMFKGYNRQLRFEPKDGLQVIAHGRLGVYEARGQYQIVVDQMEPDGLGALKLAFEQLKAKLMAEGLFDPEKKRSLPILPKRLGLVTSIKGAVLHDMHNILKRRFSNIDLLIYPVKVQGEGAADEIARAVQYFSNNQNVDTVIVARGGGSLEDLMAFNTEQVARAVAGCQVPVVSAVGHETDFSICDFVADVRAPTPSAAIEICVPLKTQLLQNLQLYRHSLQNTLLQNIGVRKKTIGYLIKTIPKPQALLDRALLKLGDIENRLEHNISIKISSLKLTLSQIGSRFISPQSWLNTQKGRLENLKTHLVLQNPKNVLARGYTLVKDPNGQIITRLIMTEGLPHLTVEFFDGDLNVQKN